MESRKFKIVGAGLAGINLAWHLYFKKQHFSIVDNGERSTSKAAAGLINPVVFRRLNKSWMADELMDYLHPYYLKINEILGEELYVNLPIKKVISDIENLNDWGARNNDDAFKKYYGEVENNIHEEIDADYGLGKVEHSGYLKIEPFIELSLAYFKENGVELINESFDYSDVSEEIIFSEGHGMLDNPYFSYLPLNQTHGETLFLKAESFDIDFILNKNMFILPLGNKTYRVGATYNWELKGPTITESAKDELLEKLSHVAKFEFEVIDQRAGLRPTVKDRRPLLGTHYKHQNLHIFNGLGTKGVMISPYFANEMCNYLIGNGKISHDVNIRRFDQLMNE